MCSTPFINPYRLKLTDYPDRIFSFEDFPGDKLKISSLASTYQEVFCEIGSGSGGHLLELGRQNPQALAIGFELRYKRTVRTIEKAEKAGIPNVYIIRIDGRRLEDFFAINSLDRIYVNFPEPWDRKKFAKHRVLNQNFLDTCYQVLRPDGLVSIKTDHLEYYKLFLETLSLDQRFEIITKTFDFYAEVESIVESFGDETFFSSVKKILQSNIKSEFEKLFLHKQVAIKHLIFSRKII